MKGNAIRNSRFSYAVNNRVLPVTKTTSNAVPKDVNTGSAEMLAAREKQGIRGKSAIYLISGHWLLALRQLRLRPRVAHW